MYLCITKLLKWSANCAQFLIHSGLSNEWTFAIPSTITTFTWCLFGPATLLLFLLLFTFSRMLIRLLLDEEWAPSAANNDLSKIQLTIENSYWPTVSLISIYGLLLHTIIIRAKRDLSSWSSTILSAAVTFTTFALVFHVKSFLFFIRGTQREYSSKPLKHRIEKNVFYYLNGRYRHIFIP